MRPTNRQKVLLFVLVLLVVLVTIYLTRNIKDPTVETMGLKATTNNQGEEFKLEYYSVITTTTTSTTTTVPPTTTTTVPPTTIATTVPPPPPTTETVTTAPVETYSGGVDWYAVAVCESGLGTGAPNWSINTGNGYYGGLQFSHSTWIAYGGGRYASDAHLTSAANQIAIASGMSLSHWPICGKHG